MWTTPTLLLSCSFHAPALPLPYSSPAPASALPLPYSCPAPFKLLSGTFLAPPQFLPSSCPLSALFCFTLLSSAPALFLPCSCPAHTAAPLFLCPTPALLLPTPVWQPSSSAPYNFFWHGKSYLLWLSSGFQSRKSLKSCFQGRKILEIKVF